MSLFFKEKGAGTAFDREGAVAEFNRHRAAQGLKPVVPGWMWPDVPKAGG